MLERMWRKKEDFYTAGGNTNMYSHFGDQYVCSSRILWVRLPQDLAIPFLGIYPNDPHPLKKSHLFNNVCSGIFVKAKSRKKHKCPSTEEWIKKMWHIYIMEYYSVVGGQQNLEILRQMDGIRRNHHKYGNPLTKWVTWYILTHIWILDIEQRITSRETWI